MQSKVTFFLIFMLSFGIFHDSMLILIDKKEQVYTIAKVECPASLSQQDNNLHTLHTIFHTLAVINLNAMTTPSLKSSKKIKYSLQQIVYFHQQIIIKPPIA